MMTIIKEKYISEKLKKSFLILYLLSNYQII